MERFSNRLTLALVAGSLALGSALAGGSAQAAVIGPGVVGAAADAGTLVEPVQFVYGGYEYCWYPDGWHGAGWYRCGFAYRVGIGWGGPVGWNNWHFRDHDRDDFRVRDHDDFRFRGHDHDHDHDRHDHDRHDRY
jgi:hypothetical protein